MKKIIYCLSLLFLLLPPSASHSQDLASNPKNYSNAAIIEWAYGCANIGSFTVDPGFYFGFEGQMFINGVATETPRLMRIIASSTSVTGFDGVEFVTGGHPAVDFEAGQITASSAVLLDVPIYADNAAAITGGLSAGDIYRTATGALMIVFTPPS